MPLGAGGSTYHININNFYNERLWKTANYGWQHDINPKSELTGDDVQILIDMIEENLMGKT